MAGFIKISLEDNDMVQLVVDGDLNYGQALQMIQLAHQQVAEAAQEALEAADEEE